MMVSENEFYEYNLKDKSAAEIMKEIRNLKREIGRLKNIMEHPYYDSREWVINPGEDVQIHMNREYLKRAKQALTEVGEVYIPSVREKRIENFDENIANISRIEFSIGGRVGGISTKTFTVNGDKIEVREEKFFREPIADEKQSEEVGRKEFFETFKELYIGEWHKEYDTYRFGVAVMAGTRWHLHIYYNNGKRAVKISGSNAYPYNFDRLLDLFGIDSEL